MNIIQYPNDILTSKSEKVTDINEVKDTLLIMKAFVESNDNTAVGLALPQVGILKRGFVAEIDGKVEIFINPLIIRKSQKKSSLLEGCMSIKDMVGVVTRPRDITLKYTDLAGKMRVVNLSGMNARVVQHEIDHLDGILFINKAFDIKEVKEEGAEIPS